MRSSRFLKSGTTAAVCLAIVQTLNAATIHVDGNLTSSGDGSSWALAKKTLQEALAIATSSDEVWVKTGTYTPGTSSSHSFVLVDGCEVYGGFAGTETLRTQADPLLNPTILNGDNSGDDDPQTPSTFNDNSYHVVKAENLYESLTRLDGFIITGGRALGSFDDASGGGLLYLATFPPISRLNVTRCRFEGNHAAGGGGVAVIRPPWPDAPSQTTFEVMFTNCTFTGNSAGKGGAAFIQGGPVYFHNSLMVGNVASGSGGAIHAAIYCDQFEDCEIRDCPLQDGTEAIVNSCTITNNETGGVGGGVYLIMKSILVAKGSIFWGNTRDDDGTPVADQIAIEDTCAVTTVTYSCVEGGFTGTGNISSNPLFVNAGLGHFQLRASSLAVDAGAVGFGFPDDDLDFDHDGVTTMELAPDLDRHKREINGQIDMGAYEHLCGCEGDFLTSATFQPPPDGIVDATDLAFLLGEWGSNPTSPADIADATTFQPDPDGEVGPADLAWLLGSWGTCTDDCEEESLLGGGPFENTEIGDLLDELLEEDDEEAAAELVAQLLELLME
jgi:hypothetical protein